MNPIVAILLTTIFVIGCSSSPAPKHDPWNDADSQRDRADKTQRELSRDTR